MSHFINTHLPELPDTMELMEKLQYDFDTNPLGMAGDVSMNDNHSKSSTSLPSLEHEGRGSLSNKGGTAKCPSCRSKQTEIDSLRRNVEALSQQLLAAKAKNAELGTKLEAAQRRGRLLENKLVGTRRVAIDGAGPRLDALQFVKYERSEDEEAQFVVNWRRTVGVQQLKESVRGGYDNGKWKCEGDNELYGYFDSILEFLNENEEDVVVPLILFPKDSDVAMAGGHHDDEDVATRPQHEVLEQFEIGRHDRVQALNGQRGLRAKVDVPAMTVLGQYVGAEYLEEEFHAAFSGTAEFAAKNMFAFTLSVGDRKKTKGPLPTIVIDPLGLEDPDGLKPVVMMLNDCRADISSPDKTAADERAENVVFAKVSLNGWPTLFVITKRRVKAGEEILGFYGSDYWDALKAKQLQQHIQQRTQHRVDNIIRGAVDPNAKRVNLL